MTRFLARLRRSADCVAVELPVSMIDVTFLLLIFFMCSMRFKTEEGVLDAVLPRDGPRIPPPPEPVPALLRVDVRRLEGSGGARSAFAARPGEVVTTLNGVPTRGPDDLAVAIGRIAKIHPDVAVVIDAGQSVPFQHVMSAIDACARAEARDVRFAPRPTGDVAASPSP